MAKKQFKAESKKLLDMMINSIYTNKEIFLRELISNSSDAIDKLYYKSLTDKSLSVKKEDLEIWVIPNKEQRTITITDNGIGMNSTELEDNLGTIAKSGSELFKENNEMDKDISIIGKFGVGFYSSFMVANKVTVESKSAFSEESYIWESNGVDGYTINKCDKESTGTTITLYLKDKSDDMDTDELLDPFKLMSIIKKYSDYIRYPIKMTLKNEEGKEEVETVNSMIPIWKKKKEDTTDKEYEEYYSDKFYDYEKPLRVIKSSVEGLTSYDSLLFIPSHAPYNYYTKEYEKGLELYSRGVMIMPRCAELLPDYFSFVKGIVDSEDISLNISRETMQESREVKLIAKNIEKKIKNELLDMLKNNRENYETFYKEFGMQIKHGIYSSYGMNKDILMDLLLFYSSKEDKYVTLSEYAKRVEEGNKEIYYAAGENINNIKMIPQVEMLINEGKEVLFLTEYLDEFVIKTLSEYNGLTFINAQDSKIAEPTEEEQKELDKINDENKDLLSSMNKYLEGHVKEVKFTNKLNNHPICLVSTGEVSLDMERILNQMGNNDKVKAETILEINDNHSIAKKLKELYQSNNLTELENYTKVLYASSRLLSGMPLDNPKEVTELICEMLSK